MEIDQRVREVLYRLANRICSAAAQMPPRGWLLVACAVIGTWQFLSFPNAAMLTPTCQPVGTVNNWRAAFLPALWRSSQLHAINEELKRERQWPQVKGQLDRALAETKALVERQRHELGLAPPSEADRLRELADEVEAREVEEMLAPYKAARLRMLLTCQQELRR